MSVNRKLVLATHNENKRLEFASLLTPFELVPLNDQIQLPEETEETFSGNALLKARAAATAMQLPALADDSGIVAQALNGAPGVRSARFAGPNASDAENLRKFIGEVPPKTFLAYVCVLAYVDPLDQTEHLVEGRCEGLMAESPRGNGGFGYDPVFEPLDIEDGRTMAELRPEEKAAISHRGRAARAMLKYICGNLSN